MRPPAFALPFFVLPAAFFALTSLTPNMAAAEDGPVVLELYTSQGCNSCPPADAMLRQMAERDDVIALALHVDYWDYIGWADVFADPAYTERQKAYARVAGQGTIYTPQMVIGGRDHVVGAHPDQVEALLDSHAAQDSGVDLNLERNGNEVIIAAEAPGRFELPAQVQLVRYLPMEEVAIRRGENAGHSFVYVNIVTDWQVIESWTGESPLALRVQVQGDQPVVVIVQEPGPGAVIAAGRAE